LGTAAVLLHLFHVRQGLSGVEGGVERAPSASFSPLSGPSRRNSVHLFYRTIPQDNVLRAFTVISLALSLIFLASFMVLVSQPEMLMKKVFYEVFSGFGTVGLSLGITSQLNTLSRSVLILLMYAGRLGPLTLLLALSRRRAFGKYEYVEENVLIG
jgi:trk system potassium uptake protein TrkH